MPTHGWRACSPSYEAPNYFAAKSEAVFDDVLVRANSKRSPFLRMLGRL